MKKLITTFLTILPLIANSTTYYWVGGSGTWDNTSTTNWSLSSGGAGNAGVPTSSDDVIFNSSSGLTGATVTTSTSAACNILTWSATVGTLSISSTTTIYGNFAWSGAGGTLSGSSQLNVAGNFTLNASMTLSFSGYLDMTATSGTKTFTTAGKTITFSTDFNGSGGTFSLQDNYNSSTSFSISAGTVTTNNYTITCRDIYISSSGTFNMGSSSITVTDSYGIFDALWISASATINAGTSTLTILPHSSTGYTTEIYMGGKTLYNLILTAGDHGYNFTANGTVSNNMTMGAGNNVTIISGGTLTVNGTLTAAGNCQSQYIYLRSSLGGSSATIASSGAQSISDLVVYDVTAATSTFTCTNCVDKATTDGTWSWSSARTTRTLYWFSNAGNFSDYTKWYTATNGGGSQATCSPNPLDNLIFDANSFSSNSNLTLDKINSFANTITWSSVDQVVTLYSTGISDKTIQVFSDLTAKSNMLTTANYIHLQMESSTNPTILDEQGIGFTNVTFGNTGTYRLASTLNADGDITINSGATLDVLPNGGVAGTDEKNITCADDWTNNGTFNERTNSSVSVTFDGSTNSTINNSETFYNLIVNKGSANYYTEPTSTTTTTISNNLTVTGGYYSQYYSSSTTAVTGNLVVSSANSKYQQTNGTTTIAGTVTIDHTTSSLVLNGGTYTWNNNSTSGFALNTGAMTVAGATVNIGTTNTHTTSVLNVGNSSGSGDVTLTVSSGTLNIADKLYVQSDGIFNVSGGTVNIKATTNNVGTATSKWVIDASGEFKQSGGTINVLGAYNTTSTYPAVAFNTSATTTAGNITAGTIVLQATTTGVADYYVNWGGKTIYSLTASTSGSTFRQLTNSVTLKGNMTISSGATYHADGLAMAIAGNWTNAGTFTHNSNTVTFNGTSTITTGGTGAGQKFYNVTLNGTSATLAGNIDIDNNFTLTAGTWDVSASNYSMNVGANWSNSGTFTPRSGTVTFDGTSTITTGGTGAGKVFYNVTNSGTSTLAGNIDIDNHFTLSGGTWDVSGSNYSMNIGGDFVNSSGTFTCRSGSVTFDGSSTQYVNVTSAGGTSPRNADVTFYTVIINGSDVKMYYSDSNSRYINITDYTINSGKQCSIIAN